MVYVLVLISVAGMTAAQLLLKKGLLAVGHFPHNLGEAPHFFLKAYTNPYVIAAVFFTIVTALAWLLAVSKAELSHVYPFMALSYVLVAVFSMVIFKEDVSLLRWSGIAVICLGVLLVSRG
jgi:uncharacterized membrane protein